MNAEQGGLQYKHCAMRIPVQLLENVPAKIIVRARSHTSQVPPNVSSKGALLNIHYYYYRYIWHGLFRPGTYDGETYMELSQSI